MGQSIRSVVGEKELNVMRLLSSGCSFDEDGLASLLDCSVEDVPAQMSRLCVLFGMDVVISDSKAVQ